MSEPTFDAREGSGDPETDPAAMGETSVAEPDGDGGAVVAAAEPTGPTGGSADDLAGEPQTAPPDADEMETLEGHPS